MAKRSASDAKPRKTVESPVVYSPCEIELVNIDGKKVKRVLRGALLPKRTLVAVTRLIDKIAVNGLSGKEAILLMALKNASDALSKI